MSYKCFYHSSDLDGKCSAAIVKYKYPNAILYPVDYYNSIKLEVKDEFRYYIEPLKDNKIRNDCIFFIDPDDIVIMCDFSFSLFDLMIFIKNNCKNFIWLDHHHTSINNAIKNNFKTDGMLDENSSGCSLTWKYFFTEKDIPYCIELIEKYDTGNFYFNNDILHFEYGMRNRDDDEINPNNTSFWKELFENSDLINEIINEGKICLKYQKKINKRLLKNVFQTKFGGWKCAVINYPKINSLFFEDLEDKDRYDILIGCSLDRKLQWSIFLYTEKPYINVAQIAEMYGGGGHKNAAAFKSKELPFKLWGI